MTSYQFIIFLIVLILPSTYQRVKFSLKRSTFMKTRIREKSGLQIHHGHWGLLIVFATSIGLVFGHHGWLSIVALGYGWGLILDEIYPLLKMPTVGREIELDIYAASLRGTIIIIACVVILATIIFALFGHGTIAHTLPSEYIG